MFDTWDSMNRLRSIDNGSTVTSFTYRPDGMRATKSVDSVLTTQYLYDGQSLVAEKDGDGVLKVSYTNGPNEVISRTEYDGEVADTIFFLYDANCNVNAIVDEDGELVKTFDYEEFGGPHPAPNVGQTLDPNNQNAANNKLQFAGGVGHLTDDSGLIYMRARYYDPASGRFISQDPTRHGMNWYAYCENNPGNAIDPSGRVSIQGAINWVADMGGWDMAALYLVFLAAALMDLGVYMIATGKVMETTGQLLPAPWPEARGAILAGDGGLLKLAAGFLTAAATICGIFGSMDDPDGAGYLADYLTSAASIGSLFGGADDEDAYY